MLGENVFSLFAGLESTEKNKGKGERRKERGRKGREKKKREGRKKLEILE